MGNSSEEKHIRHNFFRMQICGLAILCLIIACLGSSCTTPAKNVKGSNSSNSKSSQLTSQSKADTQGKSTKKQENSTVTGENASYGNDSHGGAKSQSRTSSGNKGLDAFFSNLTIEERTVLSWLIGGVLGLTFILLVIKGIISKRR